MLEKIINTAQLQQVSRPRFPEEFYWTFKEISNVFGAGNQNVVNAGSSMFRDTPTLLSAVSILIDRHMDKDSYLISYFEDNEDYKLFAKNLILFKKDKNLRKKILPQIINLDDFSFKTKIYPGYLFIFSSLYFMLNYNMFHGDRNAKTIIGKYFANEATLIEALFKAIENEDELDNLTSVCYGRFFFVDSRLSNISDLKPVPLTLGDLLVKE